MGVGLLVVLFRLIACRLHFWSFACQNVHINWHEDWLNVFYFNKSTQKRDSTVVALRLIPCWNYECSHEWLSEFESKRDWITGWGSTCEWISSKSANGSPCQCFKWCQWDRCHQQSIPQSAMGADVSTNGIPMSAAFLLLVSLSWLLCWFNLASSCGHHCW